jgi:hypothetical protein
MSRGSRRSVITSVATLVPFAIAALLALASPASAICDQPCEGPEPVIVHELTVNAPTGTVSRDPAGSPCPPVETCRFYDDGTVVTLTASDGQPGFAPAWTGCDTPSTTTCTVTMDADKTVTLGWNDVTPPALNGFTTPPRARGAFNVITGVTDNGPMGRVEFRLNGGSPSTDSSPPYEASFDVSDPAFADGSTVSITALPFDASNNAGTLATRTVTVDKHVDIALDSLPAFTSAATLPLGFTKELGAGTTCALNGGVATACSSPYSPIDATTPDGSYTYSVTATDTAGNVATVQRSFVLDRTAPQVGIASGPADGSSGTATTATFGLTVADAAIDTMTCKLDAGQPASCASMSATYASLAVGPHTFTVTGTDKAGNSTSLSRTWTVTAPPVPAQAETGGQPTGGLLANTAKVTVKAQRTARWTRLKKLRITSIPSGAKVTIACKGGKKKGCPKRKTLAALTKARLKPGAVITITIAKAGMETKTVSVTIRKGKAPKVA